MSDESFNRGNRNPAEGGSKGLDLTAGNALMAVTSEQRPLAFFETAPLLAAIDRSSRPIEDVDEADRARATLVRHLAAAGNRAAHETEAIRRGAAFDQRALATSRLEVEQMLRSNSWRITAPLRSLKTYVQHVIGRR